MQSKFRKCYVFVVEGENTKGRSISTFEVAVNEFMKTFPDLFDSLTNYDETISIYIGNLDDLKVDKVEKKE